MGRNHEIGASACNRHEPWLQRGIAYAELDDCEHAIPALERGVIGTNPDVNGMFQLSAVLFAAGRSHRATGAAMQPE